MFFLEWESKAVNDRSEDFEELGDAVVALGFVDKAVENIVDLFTGSFVSNYRFSFLKTHVYSFLNPSEKLKSCFQGGTIQSLV